MIIVGFKKNRIYFSLVLQIIHHYVPLFVGQTIEETGQTRNTQMEFQELSGKQNINPSI